MPCRSNTVFSWLLSHVEKEFIGGVNEFGINRMGTGEYDQEVWAHKLFNNYHHLTIAWQRPGLLDAQSSGQR